MLHNSPSDIAWIGTVQGFILLLVGIITGPIYDLGYFRALIMSGTFLLVFGMMMLSIADQYYQIFLAQAIVAGLGAGCLFVPSVGIVTQYFTTKRALATGIAAAGGSIGTSTTKALHPGIMARLTGRMFQAVLYTQLCSMSCSPSWALGGPRA